MSISIPDKEKDKADATLPCLPQGCAAGHRHSNCCHTLNTASVATAAIRKQCLALCLIGAKENDTL